MLPDKTEKFIWGFFWKNDKVIQAVKDSLVFQGITMKQCVSNNHAASCGKGLDLHVDSTGCTADLLQNTLGFLATVS